MITVYLVLFVALLILPSKWEWLFNNKIPFRNYFPFNLISHPDMDTYYDDETIVSNNGFLLEKHYVKTTDGYINYLANVRDKNQANAT